MHFPESLRDLTVPRFFPEGSLLPLPRAFGMGHADAASRLDGYHRSLGYGQPDRFLDTYNIRERADLRVLGNVMEPEAQVSRIDSDLHNTMILPVFQGTSFDCATTSSTKLYPIRDSYLNDHWIC